MTNTEKRITEKKQFRVCTNEMDTGRNSYAQNHRPQKFSIDCTVVQGELSVYFEYDDQFLKSGFAFQRKFQEILNLMIEDDEPRKADVGFAVPQRYFTTSERAELYQAVQAYQNAAVTAPGAAEPYERLIAVYARQAETAESAEAKTQFEQKKEETERFLKEITDGFQ